MKTGTTVIIPDGSIRVIDPERKDVQYLVSLDPGFRIVSEPAPQGFVPGFQSLRRRFINGLTHHELEEMSTAMAVAVHDAAMAGKIPLADAGEVSVLELKVEIGKRTLQACDLCAVSCGANRYKGPGRCGADADTLFNGLFEHVCEEAVINTAHSLKLLYCPMNCAFCQAPENRAPGEDSRVLSPDVWEEIAWRETGNSLEFVGGEPMVSAPGILQFLASAPDDFNLPVVMNCSAFVSRSAVNLLNGVVDVWMPDLNFGNDECARQLAGADNFWKAATDSIQAMCAQGSRVMVRMLILPGHFDCCHRPALDWLSGFRDRVWLSISDHYLPFHEAGRRGDINRLPSAEEIKTVFAYASARGLREVNQEPGGFWA
jgi:putative pyruvate formate lyase activating enzyme